ncbi:hypothetical protein [Neorickettsia sennetsu]|uniref:Uncharacterized protein n=1 Tax=Ehrlichia sennetsu (strain ATCC VR-367 / Miyayama) TaxID=222891 RepID=Q2GDH0_EHRS3|nr:hypothetical protein [Neorickettsia sennetsu]ABD45944.1 hypothetical protein NSE_0596 [Neorickettsia sennetsu str. Miyayama]
MHSGAVVEEEVGNSEFVLVYQPFYEGIMKGIRNLLFLDKTNPAYLVTQLWSAGAASIEPYSAAIKERVAVNGSLYKGAARRSSFENRKIRDANQLMCSLCIVDERSRDLFLDLFEYALCEFISDCKKRDLPVGSSSIATVLEGFREFFNKRPIYMSINTIKGAGAIKLGAPKEGYLDGDSGGSCMRFHPVFFRFKKETSQKEEVNTTILLLFLSSLIDFFSILVVNKESLFRRGGVKVFYEGLRITERGISASDAHAAECKKERMLYIANEFLASNKARRWDFALEGVEFLSHDELTYLPKRVLGSGTVEWAKCQAHLSPDNLCHDGKEVSVEEVCQRLYGSRLLNASSDGVMHPGMSGQSKILSEVISHTGSSAVLPLGNNSTHLSAGNYVVFDPVTTASAASISSGIPSMLEEPAVVESPATISSFLERA